MGSEQFGRLNMMAMLRTLINANVMIAPNAGAPTDGTSGTFAGFAGPGSLLIDTTNTNLYMNENTKASPTWVDITAVVASEIALAEGNLLLGNSSGVAAALSALTTGQVLVGDGTTLASVVMSGDATIVASGALSLTAASVSEAQLDTQLDGSADGQGNLRVCRVTYDFGINGGAVSAINLGQSIPDNALIVGGFVDVITTLTSAGDTATGAISVEGADDIVVAIAINDGSDPWDAGQQAIIPKANTPETTAVKLTAIRSPTFTIAVEAVTAGAFVCFLYYVLSD